MLLKTFVSRPTRKMLNMLVCVSLLIGMFPPALDGSPSYRPGPEPQSLGDWAVTTVDDDQHNVAAVRTLALEDAGPGRDTDPRHRAVPLNAAPVAPYLLSTPSDAVTAGIALPVTWWPVED